MTDCTADQPALRVLCFLNSVVRGGVEHHVLDLLRRVERGRFDLRLVCPPVLAEQMRAELDELAVPVDQIEIRSWRQLGAIRQFRRLLRQWRPDIVHSHLYFASRYASPLARGARVPFVLETAHIEESWRRGWRQRLALIDGLASRCCHRIIAVSNAVKDFYVQAKRVPAAKIVVVYNGIDLSRFDPDAPRDLAALREELGIEADEKVVSVVGRLAEQKGHRYLIEAAKAVVAAVPRARFVLAGRGELEAALKAQAHQLGLSDRVVFAGFRRDVDNVYALSHVVALPSLFEGLPLTVAEAQAMRRPVVATRVSGTPEVLLDGETGLLVPPRDVSALARALIRVLRDEELARLFGQRGRQHACAHFSLERQIEQTETIYERGAAGE